MTANEWFLMPALPLFVGAILVAVLPAKMRSTTFLIVAALALIAVWWNPLGTCLTANFVNYELVLAEATQLNRLFGTIFALIAFVGGIYAFHQKEAAHQVAALLYAGGALGLTFAGDFFTLFVFWEIMAVASTYLIWAQRTSETQRAGMRYLLVHLFGGALLMLGILLHITSTGSITIKSIPESSSMASWFMLAGVALNAGVPPLHAWLADAYPKATVDGAVFLSAFTTKSAVLILMKLFAGWEILFYAGVVMTLYGSIYAILSNDIRQILAYSIISQIGYMVTAIGIGTEMALNGASAHAFSHILYKSLLFMGAGVVIHTTGKSKLSELGGLAKSMPWVAALYMVGALAISGLPLLNGFISKSMIISAAGKAHHDTAMLLLLLASMATFLHTGLKLPYFTWWGNAKHTTQSPSRTPVNMLIAMIMGASLCVLFGVAPTLLYHQLPYTVEYHPYTLYHLTETAQILLFAFIAFWLLRSKLSGESLMVIDTDWVYRKPGAKIAQALVSLNGWLFEQAEQGVTWLVQNSTQAARNPLSFLQRMPYYRDATQSRSPLQIEVLLLLTTLLSLSTLVILAFTT